MDDSPSQALQSLFKGISQAGLSSHVTFAENRFMKPLYTFFPLLCAPCILSVGCAGPCVAPSPLGLAFSAPVVVPMIVLDPRSYHGKDGFSTWNAIPYLGVQKLSMIDSYERTYIVERFKIASDFDLQRERVGMFDKVTFQVRGRKRVLYFDTFPNEIAARGIKPAISGT